MNKLSANATAIPEWLDEHIWRQIEIMLFNDACFKLMGRARELTGEFNGPIGELIVNGYVTSQTVAIRRLCDDRRDVISLRRALIEAKAKDIVPCDQVDVLLSRLEAEACDHIHDLVNNYIAHTADPLRRPNVNKWSLQVKHLTKAQRTICQVAIIFERDLLQRKNRVQLVLVQHGDIMQEFRSWVPDAKIAELRESWHAHIKEVNAWVLQGPSGQ